MKQEHINDELKDTEKIALQQVLPLSKLENFVEISSSKRIYVSEYAKDGIPFYRGQEISNINNLNSDDLVYISSERYLEIKNKFGVPKTGDLLITAVGTIGNTWIVDEREFYFKDGNILWIKPKVNNMNMKYIELLIKINKNKIIDNSSGSSQNAITTSVLKNLKIYLPTLEEQNKIVKLFSLIDDLINMQVSIKKSKQLELEYLKKQLVKINGSQKLKLSKLIKIYSERNSSDDTEPVAVGKYGIRLRSEIYNNELSKDLSKNKVIFKDTITFGMGSTQIDYGILTYRARYCVSPAYIHTKFRLMLYYLNI